ncbi:MAG: hypothetical protein WB870_09500 [Gallionellaceae bacterium]
MAWIAEQLLTAIRDERVCDCITEERLVMVTGLTPRQVEAAALTLRRNGLLEKTGKGCHRITDAGMVALIAGASVHSGPRGKQESGKRVWKNTLRARVWSAIRIRRKFSVPELIALVADEGHEDITSNLQKYVRALARAGYLVELPRREPGTALTRNGYKRYWLQDAKDSGPQAPVWRVKAGTVYDPNTKIEVAI